MTRFKASTRSLLVAVGCLMAAFGMAACAADQSGEVRFLEPLDGAVVTGPVEISASVDGYRLAPAAEGVSEGSGHLHLIIDRPCVEPRLTVAMNDRHLHLVDGESTATVELTPGEHTLCLQLGRADHVALAVTDTVTITVRPEPDG